MSTDPETTAREAKFLKWFTESEDPEVSLTCAKMAWNAAWEACREWFIDSSPDAW